MPLHYRVTVRGRLHEDFTASFQGTVVMPEDDRTVLTGSTIDRAQVDGILDRLRGLGIEVIGFEITASDHRDTPSDGDAR